MKNFDWQSPQTLQCGEYGPSAVLVANVAENKKRPMMHTNTEIKVRLMRREA